MAVWQLERTTLLFYDMNVSEGEPSLVLPLSQPGEFAPRLLRTGWPPTCFRVPLTKWTWFYRTQRDGS